MSSTTLDPVSVHDLFQGIVQKQPHSVAVSYGDAQLTYAELDSASRGVASLLRQRDIGPGDFVPILTSRCLEMVACILGIIRVGACWVPMEAGSWSQERIDTVLAAVDHKVVIATEPLGRALENTITRDEIQAAMKLPHTEVLDNAIDPADPAYIIFTSGTTSRPKGVIIQHRSLANYVQQGDEEAPFNFGADARDKVLLLFSVAFDGETNLERLSLLRRFH